MAAVKPTMTTALSMTISFDSNLKAVCRLIAGCFVNLEARKPIPATLPTAKTQGPLHIRYPIGPAFGAVIRGTSTQHT